MMSVPATLTVLLSILAVICVAAYALCFAWSVLYRCFVDRCARTKVHPLPLAHVVDPHAVPYDIRVHGVPYATVVSDHA